MGALEYPEEEIFADSNVRLVALPDRWSHISRNLATSVLPSS